MILKLLKWMEKAINLKGPTWVGLFSATMLIKIWMGGEIGGDAITVYGLVLTNFVINKTVKHYVSTKVESEED